MILQPPIPTTYQQMPADQAGRKIAEHKQRFGSELLILGHHYQRDEVIEFADLTGDSLKLSQLAASAETAKYVVFCGVHFMAESADILTDDDVAVILPDLSAGCSMADMADEEQVEQAWARLTQATDAKIVPITYVNSTAAIKAFCGRHGGACCTSSNARSILEYALAQGDKVMFLPDQHLGRNTAYAMGYPLESMVLYNPLADDGGLTDGQIRDARFILWQGHCSVHQLFTLKDCQAVRQNDPDCTIIVHPECSWEVVQASDLAGSTEYIIKTLSEAPAGSRWAVGTEIHLVNRLADRFRGEKEIRSLARMQCLCTTMYRIDRPHLLWCLDELAAGRVVNQISVPAPIQADARLALQRMLDHVRPIVSAQPGN